MNNRRSWLRRGALAVAVLSSTVLGAATTYADVTVTQNRIGGARYRLQAVATGEPCDEWKWTKHGSADATLDHDDRATVEAVVGVGVYVFRATCIRYEGENETSWVTIDTRPSNLDSIPAAALWNEVFDGPLCLHCPDWLSSLDDSMLDVRQEGYIRTDLDFSTFLELAQELATDPTPTPMLPDDLELSFGGLDTYASTVEGEDLGAGVMLVGYTHDGIERITTGSLAIGEGLVIGAFLLEAMDDPSPQPS